MTLLSTEPLIGAVGRLYFEHYFLKLEFSSWRFILIVLFDLDWTHYWELCMLGAFLGKSGERDFLT